MLFQGNRVMTLSQNFPGVTRGMPKVSRNTSELTQNDPKFNVQIKLVQEFKMPGKNIWSKSRPQKPNRDPLLDDLIRRMGQDNRSKFAKANVSGLSPSTLTKWERGQTKRPQGVSLQMAYKMLGYELKPVEIA